MSKIDHEENFNIHAAYLVSDGPSSMILPFPIYSVPTTNACINAKNTPDRERGEDRSSALFSSARGALRIVLFSTLFNITIDSNEKFRMITRAVSRMDGVRILRVLRKLDENVIPKCNEFESMAAVSSFWINSL